MKNLLLFISLCCFLGFSDLSSDKNAFPESNEDQVNFDWLLGSWKRTNDQEGSQTFEHWEKIDDAELKGGGYTLKALDTVWQESIRLIKSKDSWNFEVTGQDAVEPVIFKVTQIDMESFTCENKANEFPKKIRYAKVEKGLNAVISGDGKVVLFQFVRIP